jgi:hypothetical protein
MLGITEIWRAQSNKLKNLSRIHQSLVETVKEIAWLDSYIERCSTCQAYAMATSAFMCVCHGEAHYCNECYHGMKHSQACMCCLCGNSINTNCTCLVADRVAHESRV